MTTVRVEQENITFVQGKNVASRTQAYAAAQQKDKLKIRMPVEPEKVNVTDVQIERIRPKGSRAIVKILH